MDGATNKVVKFEIRLLSMVDVVGSSWSEFARIATGAATAMAIKFDQQWLCRYPCPKVCCYPRPKACGHDNGNEFLGWEFQEMMENGMDKKFVMELLRESCCPTIVGSIKECKWDNATKIITTAAQAEEDARLQEKEKAVWYRDEFGNNMIDKILDLVLRNYYLNLLQI